MHLKLLIEGKLAEVNGEHLNAIGARVEKDGMTKRRAECLRKQEGASC